MTRGHRDCVRAVTVEKVGMSRLQMVGRTKRPTGVRCVRHVKLRRQECPGLLGFFAPALPLRPPSLPPQGVSGHPVSVGACYQPVGVPIFPSEHVHFICVVRACLPCQPEIHMGEQGCVHLLYEGSICSVIPRRESEPTTSGCLLGCPPPRAAVVSLLHRQGAFPYPEALARASISQQMS